MEKSQKKPNNWFSDKLKVIPQQIRSIFVLFVILMAIFIIGRKLLIPKTFGKYGHYRAAAVDLNMAVKIKYAGQQACAECHDDVVELKSQYPHRNISCESCHGPAYAHSQDPGEQAIIVPKDRDFCLVCHDYNASRPTGFPQIDGTTHNPAKVCMTCHQPHSPTLPQTPGECSACHSEVARTKASSLHKMIACTQCHNVMEEHKLNPKKFIPALPQTRALCGTCHAGGAETVFNAPRVDMATHGGNYVCWQCHYPHFPEVKL